MFRRLNERRLRLALRRLKGGRLRFEPLERREVLDAGGIDSVPIDVLGGIAAVVGDASADEAAKVEADAATIGAVPYGPAEADAVDAAYAAVVDQIWGGPTKFPGPVMTSLDEDPPPEDPPSEDPPPEDPPPEDPPPEDPPPEDPPPEDPPPEDPPPEDPPPEDPPPEDPPPEDPPLEDPPVISNFEVQVGFLNVLTVRGDVVYSDYHFITVHIVWHGVEYTAPIDEDGFYWQAQLEEGECGMVFGWATDQHGRESNFCQYWAGG